MFFLPPDVHVGPIDSLDMERVTLADGTACLVNLDTDEIVECLPESFEVRSVFLVNRSCNHW